MLKMLGYFFQTQKKISGQIPLLAIPQNQFSTYHWKSKEEQFSRD